MARHLLHKNRLLRDGREVEVLKTFWKTAEAGYPRQAAQVVVAETGEHLEIWYSSLVEHHREEWARARKASGKWNYKLAALLAPPDCHLTKAFEIDGLVICLKGPNRYARITAPPISDEAGRKRMVLRNAVGQRLERPMDTYPVRFDDGQFGLIDITDIVPMAGPGIARLWRGRAGEMTGRTTDAPPTISNVSIYLSGLPGRWHPESLIALAQPEKLERWKETEALRGRRRTAGAAADSPGQKPHPGPRPEQGGSDSRGGRPADRPRPSDHPSDGRPDP